MEESTKHENINLSEAERVLKELPIVNNMQSNAGNDIANQFIISGFGYTLFQSYQSPIALRKGGITYIFKNWNYSVTTGKYRNMFLNECKKETVAKLKSGEYVKVDFEVV